MKHIPQHPVLIQYVSKSVFSLHVRHTLAVLKKEVLIHSYKNMQIKLLSAYGAIATTGLLLYIYPFQLFQLVQNSESMFHYQ